MSTENDDSHERQRRARSLLAARARLEQVELIEEIVATAARITAARSFDGEPIVRVDAVWRLLFALERSRYCWSISDAARALRMRRQSAHETACRAEVAGLVELAHNPDDRRIVQIVLTRAGRAALATTRSIESRWRNVLLNGLEGHRLVTTVHVLRVIRERLMRDERARGERERRA